MVIGLIAIAWMVTILLAIAMCRAAARSDTTSRLAPGDRRRYYAEFPRSGR